MPSPHPIKNSNLPIFFMFHALHVHAFMFMPSCSCLHVHAFMFMPSCSHLHSFILMPSYFHASCLPAHAFMIHAHALLLLLSAYAFMPSCACYHVPSGGLPADGLRRRTPTLTRVHSYSA